MDRASKGDRYPVSDDPGHGFERGPGVRRAGAKRAYNGHFESTCYHPLLLFNAEGDCLAAKLRPGNVHSAEGWGEVLLTEIERHHRLGKEAAFRADAALCTLALHQPSQCLNHAIQLS